MFMTRARPQTFRPVPRRAPARPANGPDWENGHALGLRDVARKAAGARVFVPAFVGTAGLQYQNGYVEAILASRYDITCPLLADRHTGADYGSGLCELEDLHAPRTGALAPGGATPTGAIGGLDCHTANVVGVGAWLASIGLGFHLWRWWGGLGGALFGAALGGALMCPPDTKGP